MSKNRFISTTISNIPLKGYVQSDGGTGTGSDVDFLSLNIDFTGYVDYLLFVSGHTAISEDANSSNTTRLRIILRDSLTSDEQIICGSRQALGSHNGPNMASTFWTGDTLAYMSTSGYFALTSAYTTNNCTIRLNGGIDGGAFHWGDQSGYNNFDGENLGASLYYILYKQ
jgi:hypothetical protein